MKVLLKRIKLNFKMLKLKSEMFEKRKKGNIKIALFNLGMSEPNFVLGKLRF